MNLRAFKWQAHDTTGLNKTSPTVAHMSFDQTDEQVYKMWKTIPTLMFYQRAHLLLCLLLPPLLPPLLQPRLAAVAAGVAVACDAGATLAGTAARKKCTHGNEQVSWDAIWLLRM